MKLIPPSPWLEKLQDLAAGSHADLHAEAIHDFRIATGRLRVWLALSGTRVLQDDLRWLRNAAGPLRDLDIVIERFGSRTWAKGLFERRDLLAEQFVATLSDARVRGLLAALGMLPALPGKSARKRTSALREAVERLGARAHREADDLEPIHRLRRAVRRLRYAVEWQECECSQLENLQDALGEVGDLATAHKHMAEIGAIEGAQADLAEIETEIARHRLRALAEWKRARRFVEAL